MSVKIFTEEEQKEKARQRAKNWYWKNRERALAVGSANQKKNREGSRARSAKWRAKHREEKKAASAEYRKKNADKINEYFAKRRREQKAKIKEINRRYYLRNPGKVHSARVRRIAVGEELSPDIVVRRLVFQKGRCAICRCSLKKTGHHIDHIMPLFLGGRNVDGNIQLTCPKCNRQKGHRCPVKFMQKKGFLL